MKESDANSKETSVLELLVDSSKVISSEVELEKLVQRIRILEQNLRTQHSALSFITSSIRAERSTCCTRSQVFREKRFQNFRCRETRPSSIQHSREKVLFDTMMLRSSRISERTHLIMECRKDIYPCVVISRSR